MSDWKPLVGRMSLFHAPVAVDVYQLFKSVWGDPQSFQSAQNPMMPSIAQGNGDGFAVILASQPGRVDVNINPPTKGEPEETASVSFIEDWLVVKSQFEKVIATEAFEIPKTSRIALNVQLGKLASTIEAANQEVCALIPADYRPTKLTNQSDFALQVNNPSPSLQFKDIGLNFISRWSVESVAVFNIALPKNMGVIGGGGVPTITPSNFTIGSVLLEANSVPEQNKTLEPKVWRSLVSECNDWIATAVKQYGME